MSFVTWYDSQRVHHVHLHIPGPMIYSRPWLQTLIGVILWRMKSWTEKKWHTMLSIYGVQSMFHLWMAWVYSWSLGPFFQKGWILGTGKARIMILWWGKREHSASRPCLGVTKWNLGRSMQEWTYFARQMCWGLKAKNLGAPKGRKKERRASYTSPSFYGPAIIHVKKLKWWNESEAQCPIIITTTLRKQPRFWHHHLTGALFTLCRNHIKPTILLYVVWWFS